MCIMSFGHSPSRSPNSSKWRTSIKETVVLREATSGEYLSRRLSASMRRRRRSVLIPVGSVTNGTDHLPHGIPQGLRLGTLSHTGPRGGAVGRGASRAGAACGPLTAEAGALGSVGPLRETRRTHDEPGWIHRKVQGRDSAEGGGVLPAALPALGERRQAPPPAPYPPLGRRPTPSGARPSRYWPTGEPPSAARWAPARPSVRRVTRHRIPSSARKNSEKVLGPTDPPRSESLGGQQHVGKAATVPKRCRTGSARPARYGESLIA